MTNNIYLTRAVCGCKLSIEITEDKDKPVGRIIIEKACEEHGGKCY